MNGDVNEVMQVIRMYVWMWSRGRQWR
jgi:hypothetical protein